MHRCSSSHAHGNCSYTPCSSCGFYQAPTNSFSMFFSMPNHQQQVFDEVDYAHTHADAYPYAAASSSSVDCTLSLGTPSTRQTSYNFMDHHSNSHKPSSSSSSKKLSWDIFHTKKSSTSSSGSKSSKGGNANNLSTGDPLLARRCANCDTTSTPLWRNGPRGPKSLCNACGIRYKKEERRAANNYSSSTTTINSNTTASTMMDPHYYMGHHQMNSWTHQGNEFRFIEDNEGDSVADNAIPSFLSWRLNVPADNRASLVHDYS